MADKKNQKPTGSDPDLTITWHNLVLEKVFTTLKAPAEGLSSEEVKRR